MSAIKLGIIEDEPLVQENLQAFFATQPDIELQFVYDRVEEALQEGKGKPLDIILLDIGLPGMSGLEGIRLLKQDFKPVDIIMLTSYEDPDKIFKALHAGADAYLIKRSSLQQIREAVLIVNNGGSFMSPSIARKVVDHFAPPKRKANTEGLTDRQSQIVEGLVEGLSYKMIADRLSISVETVRDHIKRIYKRLHVNSKAEVIRKKMDGEI
ncbi:MAG TPA: response regulator transcription factor [Phaeodactylibacter sp.]|nr:response regulator transcription factor [Phaeodactylibacter sp.]